jgi:hypothetical protein
MTEIPVIDVHGETATDLARAVWLRSIFDATAQLVRNHEEPLHEVCYWPGSIAKMDFTPDVLTIFWSDAVMAGCFGWAFRNAWSELGDDTPVEHVFLDDIYDAEREAAAND